MHISNKTPLQTLRVIKPNESNLQKQRLLTILKGHCERSSRLACHTAGPTGLWESYTSEGCTLESTGLSADIKYTQWQSCHFDSLKPVLVLAQKTCTSAGVILQDV
jgi:hypothetical protein